MSSYDDIYQCFIDNCGVDTSRLPSTDQGKYNMIVNAARHYNSRISDEDIVGKIICDNIAETINADLDDTRMLILAFCIKYVYLENQLVGFEELWSPFQKEVGVKDYRSQVQGRENTLERVEQKITELLTNIEDPDIMGV